MGNVIMILQFILSLSILVILHECGHFFPARWFKTRVEKFYLFMDPYFSLFKKKIGDTEYGIGWLPLGGYVKISGMVDESFDTEQLKKEPQPWEFRSKPAWQRLIIMLGGVTVNFVLGFFIFAMLLWINGIEYLPNTAMKHGIYTDSLSYEMGFRDGDQIVAINGKTFDRFDKGLFLKSIIFENNTKVDILRSGQSMSLNIDPKYIGILTKPESKSYELWGIPFPSKVGRILENSGAAKAGILKGDVVIGINEQPVQFIHELVKLTKNKPSTTFQFQVLRNLDTLIIPASSDDKGVVGLGWETAGYYETKTEHFTLLASIPKGIDTGIDLLGKQLKGFSMMFSGKINAKDSLGGFAAIANMFDKSWNWISFWRMTAILSIILGFMNLLPIPALDGGYVVFLLIEVFTGRKVPDRIIEKATMIGFILLIGLLLFANGLDVMRYFNK